MKLLPHALLPDALIVMMSPDSSMSEDVFRLPMVVTTTYRGSLASSKLRMTTFQASVQPIRLKASQRPCAPSCVAYLLSLNQ